MIEIYFGFKKPPFGQEIATSQLMETYDGREAAARLSHVRSHRGLFCLTGEPGSGKTSVLRKFVDGLNPQTHIHAYTPHASVSRNDFYRQINQLLGLPLKVRKCDLFDQIQRAVLDLYARQGKIPCIILDECQMMDHETLQEIKIITNFEMDSKLPFILCLIGQPEFREKLKRRIHEPLNQRIVLRYHMAGMTPEETRAYVLHHLKIAGRADPLFEEPCFELIQNVSAGLPRRVSGVCKSALSVAMLKKSQVVTADHVLQASAGQ
jgi:type II secretory pathway predicted ATPase ExeA